MRTVTLVSGLVGIVVGLVALALGLRGFEPSWALEAVGAILMALGAAAEGYVYGAARTTGGLKGVQGKA
jgi:hypothetical protein